MPEPLYLEPSADLLQGDIFDEVPYVYIDARPLKIARPFKQGAGGRHLYAIHDEYRDDPRDGYRWTNRQNPELIVARAQRGPAVVLTHDCELENEPDYRHVAPIRLMTELLPEYQERCRAGERWDAFPLARQGEAPAIIESFVDFKKITTMRPSALDASVKIASMSEELRKALSAAYWNYLHHAYQAPR